jgi:polyphenol oxidase
MSFISCGGLRYFRFENLDEHVSHGIFTRHGGASPAPWASLNFGGTVGDAPDRVKRNRTLGLEALGREPTNVYDVWQVHGITVAIATTPRLESDQHLQADAILTDRPGLTLMMRFADCVPILLYDPVVNVVGLVHAGWLGTVRGVVRETIKVLKSKFGSDPKDLVVGIGPSIGPDHYEVGNDVIRQVEGAFGQVSTQLLTERSGRVFFDLWAANRKYLEEAGVANIEISGLCTVCHNEDWYSHRAEHGKTGRFGVLIGLA